MSISKPKPIKTRSDIELLVNSFYLKVRKDEILGDIFNSHIADEEWATHLSKLADFWETNLFGISKFRGSPTQKHLSVDRNLNYTIEQTHFGRWLQLWFETIDSLYEGEMADKAKRTAQKMATGQFITIWKNRPENKIN